MRTGLFFLRRREDLRHALDLDLAADDGVELVLLGERGEVAAEVVEDRGLGLVCHLSFAAGGAGAPAAARGLVGGGARGGLAAEDRVELGPDGVVGHRERLLQDLGRHVLVVAEERQEQVLGPDHVGLVELGLEVGDLEDLLGLLRERDVPDGQRPAGRADRVLDGLLELEQVAPEVPEDLDGDPLALADDPEQQVLGADVVVPEPDRLLTGVRDHVADAVGEVAFHVKCGMRRGAGVGGAVRTVDATPPRARRRRRSRSRRSGSPGGCRRRTRGRRGRRGSRRSCP